jgi:serpin B
VFSSSVLVIATGCSNQNDACKGSDTAPPSSTAVVTPQLDRTNVTPVDANTVPKTTRDAAVSANNQFTVDLYRQLSSNARTTNLLASPMSASVALTMTYFGAVGQTASEMATVLHVSGDPNTIADGQGALARVISSRGAAALSAAGCGSTTSYQLELVNSLWGERTYPWEQPFLDILARGYDSGVAKEDFIGAPTQALDAINGWVSAKTNGTIDNLLPPTAIDATTRMLLVNAIHLKLPWATNFDPAKTASAAFTKADQSMVSTPFMNLASNFAYDYEKEDGTQSVGLPLSGQQIYIIVTLPPPGMALAAYEASLTPSSSAFTVPTTLTDIQLSLPKISFTSPAFSLASALDALGMHLAFDANQADFTGMCSNPPDHGHLHIQDVYQKAMVEMKETGVEAAAATAVESCNCDAISTPLPVIVNRPYLVSIVDQPTGAILFVGHIEDPTDAGVP